MKHIKGHHPAPSTRLSELCKTYSLASSGTVSEMSSRLLSFLAGYRQRMVRAGAPKCFMENNDLEICNQCRFRDECFSTVNDIKRVEREIRRYLIKKKLQPTKGKSK